MLEIKTIPVGMLETNCYLALHRESNVLYIIDPGADADAIIEEARSMTFDRAVILLTHAHVDHISALDAVKNAVGADLVYLHSADHELYKSPFNALEPYVPAAQNLPEPSSIYAADGLEIIEVPGHTRGGVAFYFPAEKTLFSGDTLFAGSVGRTDFPGGSWDALYNSITKKLLTLPPDTRIYPGHGCPTTVANEKTNPYLR